MSDSGEHKLAEDSPKINRVTFVGASSIILVIALWGIIAPENAAETIGVLVNWVSEGLGWYYILLATVILVFVVIVAVSKYGKITLGPVESKPDYNLFTWGAMLFAAGIGIDLMFFSVSEPVTQYLQPPQVEPESLEATRDAVVWALFHYGITGWAMYALMGMTLGYFAFRRGLPLAVRAALYPIIGKRIHGRPGHAVDIAAALGTVFGVATSLGIGVVQLNFGLNFMFGIPQGTAAQIGLIVLAVLMATMSAVSGVDRGIRRLSQLNVILAAALMLFVLFADNPVYLLDALVLNIGDYIANFGDMTLNTFAYDRPTEWLNSWTLFFWAWWIAWAPFVGLFLARISRGRTIREFVAATLIIPFMFTATFLSVFGNSALRLVREGNEEFGQVAANTPEQGFYTLLAQYPGVTFSAGLATVVGLLLYVTSADSGALVLGNLTSKLSTSTAEATSGVRVFWSAVIGVLTLAMLIVGGVGTLQNATIIMGLPFSVVMVLVMWGLYKALRQEGQGTDQFLPAGGSEGKSDAESERVAAKR